VIMGDKHMDSLAIKQSMPIKEHVGTARQSDVNVSDHFSNHISNGMTRTVEVKKERHQSHGQTG
jgi:hypothetical protein